MGSAENIEQCLSLIIEKKFQEAKTILDTGLKNSTSNRVLGAAAALEGLIAMQSAKSPVLPFNLQMDMARIRKMLSQRESSIWSDDFDRGYFSTWKKFHKLALEKGLLSQDEGIVKNPDEEEQHDVAAQPSSE
ncbi:MAG: hypothetical protein HYU02_01095 [Thaumarchaeota archaeon]|nr:hypothetical protein [Nitrososphaerota archaeon]